MNITNRLFTYPVLSNEKDDYINSTFIVDFNYFMSGVSTLTITYDIDMDCPDIQKLIDNGDAEFLIHIECSSTAYRTTVRAKIPAIQIDIPIGRINGTVEMVAFVVACDNIKNFNSSDWINDFENMTFSLDKGSILAYCNLKELDIAKDYEEFSNASSIFLIFKRITNEEKPIEIDMESNKIKIGLGTNEYSIYTRFYKRVEMQPILNSMIILPSLVFVFEELKQEDGIERYKNRKWFQSLERAYERRGISLENEILREDKKSIVLAQEAMNYPISNGLTQMLSIYEEEEEE